MNLTVNKDKYFVRKPSLCEREISTMDRSTGCRVGCVLFQLNTNFFKSALINKTNYVKRSQLYSDKLTDDYH